MSKQLPGSRPLQVMLAAIVALTMLGSVSTQVDAAPPDRESYIVVLKPGARAAHRVAADVAGQQNGKVGFVYQHAIQGFSIQVPAAAVAGLERNPNVAYIEADHVVQASAQITPTGVTRSFADTTLLHINGTDDYRVDADVAVLDSGIDLDHPDLSVSGGTTCLTGTCTGDGDDDSGHGTHVAGIVGALDNDFGSVGIAPGARLWSVKVLDSNGVGSLSGVIAGIDWVTANADTIEVANMSLNGQGKSRAEEAAIQAAVDAGVAFAVAAGNNSDRASRYSPAAFDNVMTVSAIADFDGMPGGVGSPTCLDDVDDNAAYFTNHGRAVDIAAPGVCIYSTLPVEMGSYTYASGTSMSSPYVAGALALLASQSNPSSAADVEAMYAQLIANGNHDWVDDSDRYHEPLLDLTGIDANMVQVGPPPPPPTPTPEPTPGPTPTPGPIVLNLSVEATKVSGAHVATLTWSGADAVNILRDGPVIAVDVTTSPYVDELGTKGNGQASYLVCTTDMTVCSELAYANW